MKMKLWLSLPQKTSSSLKKKRSMEKVERRTETLRRNWWSLEDEQ